MNSNFDLPVVLGGKPTWLPKGPVKWDRWGGTCPTWDPYLNFMDANAVQWPMRTPGTVAAAAQAVAGEWAFSGPLERELEQRLREEMDVLDVTMAASGTAALMVMWKALMAWAQLHGRQVPGRPEVILPKMTFHATASTAAEAGLQPVMIDTGRNLLPTVEAYRAAITENTVGFGVVPLYLGVPPIDELWQLANELGLFVGIDGAQAPFARWRGRPLEEFAHAKTTSQQYGKEWTSGEGGTASSNDRLVAALIRLAIVGKVPAQPFDWWPVDELNSLQALNGGVSGLQGDNLRYNEILAGIALEQLKIFPAQAEHKQAQFDLLVEATRQLELPFELVPQSGTGFLYKVAVWNHTRVATPAMLQAARMQMTGEWGPPYIPMDDPDSGFKPQTVPWQMSHVIVPPSDPATYSGAADAHQNVMLLAGDQLLRHDAAAHILHTLQTLAASEDGLDRWAQANSRLA